MIRSTGYSTPLTTMPFSVTASTPTTPVSLEAAGSVEVVVPDIGDFDEVAVIEIFIKPGDAVKAGDTLFSLDGRASVAVPGDFAFYRKLDVGSVGPDVKQLEQILVNDGYPIAHVDGVALPAAPGPITERLQAAWRDLLADDLDP